MLARLIEQVVTSLRCEGFSQTFLAKPANQPSDKEEQRELNSIDSGVNSHWVMRPNEEDFGNQRRKKSSEKARTKASIPGAQAHRQNKHQIRDIVLQCRLQQPPCKQCYGYCRQGDTVGD